MDPLWLVLGLIVAAILALTVLLALPWYRKHGIDLARASLKEVPSIITRIDNSLQPYLSSKEYLPERVGRPLRSEIQTLVELTLPSLRKRVRRAHDGAMRKDFESITIAANQLRQNLIGHNYQYVQQAINEHSKLLVEELKLDAAQREATVRDNERNLVIAAAGSGKTRTLTARVRYLLARRVAPSNILAITFTNKATEEMEDRLKQMSVQVADQRSDGVTVSTLHALGKRIVQAATPGPLSIADEHWTNSLVASALRDAREGQDQQLSNLYINAILNFHRDLDERTPALGVDLAYRTHHGEQVRSIGERIIADFLLTHQVPYKYEATASWAQVGAGRTAYHPDFTLLDTGACIEYWGVDRAGNVPGNWSTSSADYGKGMAWKRGEFSRTDKKLIEFYDMLHRAADIVEKGASSLPKFDHVLVDEFQDTSTAMARLVNALVQTNHAHLFAVGDDWQAIYGFAGGDIDHVVNFESHFGPASLTILNTNYRSPAIIVEAGAALIAHNPSQIPKQVAISNQERGEAYIHEVPDNDLAIIDKTISLIKEERKRTSPDDILVLSRTNHLLKEVQRNFVPNRIPLAAPNRNITGVRVMSAHKAKGLEADVVVVVNASDDLLGFPSKIENPDVLEPVRMHPGNDRAEERRLFYVAVTRAKRRLHLIVRQNLPSPYIAEIEGTTYSQKLNQNMLRPGSRFNDTFRFEQLYPLTESQKRARIQQCGLLTTNMGEFSFTSWMAYYLEHDGTYQITGVFLESPYQNRQRVKLDRDTRVQRRIRPQSTARANSTRQLLPS